MEILEAEAEQTWQGLPLALSQLSAGGHEDSILAPIAPMAPLVTTGVVTLALQSRTENCPMQELPTESTRDLFTPIEAGPLTLPNRIVMAPLTRSRAGPGNVPTLLSALYYAQRASAGLIISEATQVAPEGQGYVSTPGIHSAQQVAGWKCVTDAVHACGGRMVLQLCPAFVLERILAEGMFDDLNTEARRAIY